MFYPVLSWHLLFDWHGLDGERQDLARNLWHSAMSDPVRVASEGELGERLPSEPRVWLCSL